MESDFLPLQALIKKYPLGLFSEKDRSTTGLVCPLHVRGICLAIVNEVRKQKNGNERYFGMTESGGSPLTRNDVRMGWSGWGWGGEDYGSANTKSKGGIKGKRKDKDNSKNAQM